MNAESNNKPVIVCVEDDRMTLDLIKLSLGDGYNFIGVSNPSDAMAVLTRFRPNLILLDIMMPEISGWEIFRRVRNDELLKDVPVMMLTAKSAKVDRIYGEQVAKVDRYLLKPFEPRELKNAVQEVLAERADKSE